MPDRIITAEALITAKDGTGDTFARIASKLQGVGKSAAVSKDIDRMAQSLERAQSQMRAIDKFQASRTSFSDARTKFNQQKVAVEQMARAIAQTEAPTRKMQGEFQRLQGDVSRSAAAFDKQKVAMLDAKRAVEGFGLPLGNAAQQQAKLRSSIDQTTKAIEHQAIAEHKAARDASTAHAAAERDAERRAHFMTHHSLAGVALGAAAGAVGVHSVLRVGEAAWEAGAERQHALVGMRSAGMSADEIDRAHAQAEEVSRQAPNLSVSHILDLHKEARSAVQHPEEVFELMPDLAKAASVLKGMGNEGNIADLVKAGESLGLMGHPERFHKFLDGQVRAMQVFGRTISTDQIYEAAKYSKATGSTLSDDFLNGTMPSLIQEMHGSSAGDALSSLTGRLRGGLAHQHLAVEQLNRMGLLEDPSKIRRAKGSGEIMGYTGKMKGDALLTSDPGKWFQTVFKEGAAKLGATSLEDINKLLSETLPKTAANLGRIFIQQEDSIRQHNTNLHNATGMDETMRLQREDWAAATGAFKASLEDFGAAVTGVNMGRAAKGLSWLSDEIKAFSKLTADNPYIAVPAAAGVGGGALATAGVLGWKLATAGASLQTAATMLQEAAIKQGASSSTLGKGLLGGGAVAAEGGAGMVAGGAIGLAAGVGVAGSLIGLEWLIHQSAEAQKAGHGGAWAPVTFETRDTDEYALAEQKDRLGNLQARADRARSAAKFPDMPNPVLQQLEDEIADLRNQIAAREASLARVPKFPIGPVSDGNAPNMLGFGARGGRNGGLALPDILMIPSVGINSLIGGPLPAFVDPNREQFGPYIPGNAKLGHEMLGPVMPHPQVVAAPLDIRPPAQRDAMAAGPATAYPVGQPQTIDVTGKVASDVNITTGGVIRVDVQASPELLAKVGFQGITTDAKATPPMGASMPNAGLAYNHPGRMGPN